MVTTSSTWDRAVLKSISGPAVHATSQTEVSPVETPLWVVPATGSRSRGTASPMNCSHPKHTLSSSSSECGEPRGSQWPCPPPRRPAPQRAVLSPTCAAFPQAGALALLPHPKQPHQANRSDIDSSLLQSESKKRMCNKYLISSCLPTPTLSS